MYLNLFYRYLLGPKLLLLLFKSFWCKKRILKFSVCPSSALHRSSSRVCVRACTLMCALCACAHTHVCVVCVHVWSYCSVDMCSFMQCILHLQAWSTDCPSVWFNISIIQMLRFRKSDSFTETYLTRVTDSLS